MRAVGSKLQAAEQQALMVKNGLNKEATMAVLLRYARVLSKNDDGGASASSGKHIANFCQAIPCSTHRQYNFAGRVYQAILVHHFLR